MEIPTRIRAAVPEQIRPPMRFTIMPQSASHFPVRRSDTPLLPPSCVLAVLGGWSASAMLAQAQGTVGPPGAKADVAPATLSELFHAGGLMMYPLVGLSVLAVALIVFYTFSIRQGAVVSDRFMDEAETLIRKGDYLGLLQVASRRNECIARITQKTLEFATQNPTASFDDVREVTEAEGTRQASLLSGRISILADIITVAPMVGLLGTVLGMIAEMRTISKSINSVQMEFASGVAEALIATAGGLLVAIPCVLAYAVFRGRVQRLIAELEAAATHLMALLSAQYKKATARAAAQRAAATRPPPEAVIPHPSS
jgi:biopolymer transport protein ExbB